MFDSSLGNSIEIKPPIEPSDVERMRALDDRQNHRNHSADQRVCRGGV